MLVTVVVIAAATEAAPAGLLSAMYSRTLERSLAASVVQATLIVMAYKLGLYPRSSAFTSSSLAWRRGRARRRLTSVR